MGSTPEWVTGQIPTAVQWNDAYGAKIDDLIDLKVEPVDGTTLTATTYIGSFTIVPLGGLATLTVVLPGPSIGSLPTAGPLIPRQRFEISTTQVVGAVTVTAPDGLSVTGGGPFALGANQGAHWQYDDDDKTWYRRYQSTASIDTGITQLTGDVLAGPGSGSVSAALAVVNEDVGAFTYASVQVDAKGRVLAAASGAPPVAPPVSANPTATAGPVAVNGTASSYMTSDSAPALDPDIAYLSEPDQTQSGGANITSFDHGIVTTGTLTVDCGQCPLQFVTNDGDFSIAAPAADGSAILLVTNSTSAGTVGFVGFSGGTHGDALDTTDGNQASIFVWRINGTADYNVKAHQ